MKQGLDKRLRSLEEKAVEQKLGPVVELRWLTDDEIKRGVQPGLYDLPTDDADTGPRKRIRLISYA